LTVAANLVPLALSFQALTTHSGAMFATLFRRAAVEPQRYVEALAQQLVQVTPDERLLAMAALALAGTLGLLWSLARLRGLQVASAQDRMAAQLSPAQARFVDDALPAAINAVLAKASERRHLVWSVLWVVVATPVLLLGAYAAYQWFGILQEHYALGWIRGSASDFAPFASGEAGHARYAIPIALVFSVFLLNRPLARLLMRNARYDDLAFAQPMAEVLRGRLIASVAAGATGPGQAFDAKAFADTATRRTFWLSLSLLVASVAVAAYSGFVDVARGVAFTADGVIVQDNFFSPPQKIAYHDIQAVAVDCKIGPWGGRPVYELSLPNGRVVDMIGDASLKDRIDQYLAVDSRLQFSGVGYAYPPGDLMPCLKAIEGTYNPVIAAGTAKLLHVID
jgi:hypothetical protein